MFPYTLSTKLLHTNSFGILSLKLLYSYINPFPTNVPFFAPWNTRKRLELWSDTCYMFRVLDFPWSHLWRQYMVVLSKLNNCSSFQSCFIRICWTLLHPMIYWPINKTSCFYYKNYFVFIIFYFFLPLNPWLLDLLLNLIQLLST